ncbi:MAG TPA: hypothetical protein VGD98_25680 [Ktedonobacteraceae bacterium]
MEDTQPRFLARPQVKVVRPSNRRKFLVGALGAAAILALLGIFVSFVRVARSNSTSFFQWQSHQQRSVASSWSG